MNFGEIYYVHIPNENAYYKWSLKMRAALDPKKEYDVKEIMSLSKEEIASLTGLSGEILRGLSKMLAHRHILKQGVSNNTSRISIFDAESGYTRHFASYAERLDLLPNNFDMMWWHSLAPYTEYDNDFFKLQTVSSLASYIINGSFMSTFLNHLETRAWVAFAPYISDMVNSLITNNQAFVLGTKKTCIMPSPRATRMRFNEIQTALTGPTKQALLDAADAHFNEI